MCSTSSCRRPLLARTSGRWTVAVPSQSLKRPPASSTIGLMAATSQTGRRARPSPRRIPEPPARSRRNRRSRAAAAVRAHQLQERFLPPGLARTTTGSNRTPAIRSIRSRRRHGCVCPLRKAPSPRKAWKVWPRAGTTDHAGNLLVLVLQADQGRPERDAAHELRVPSMGSMTQRKPEFRAYRRTPRQGSRRRGSGLARPCAVPAPSRGRRWSPDSDRASTRRLWRPRNNQGPAGPLARPPPEQPRHALAIQGS